LSVVCAEAHRQLIEIPIVRIHFLFIIDVLLSEKRGLPVIVCVCSLNFSPCVGPLDRRRDGVLLCYEFFV
jgi:hypothetical protein